MLSTRSQDEVSQSWSCREQLRLIRHSAASNTDAQCHETRNGEYDVSLKDRGEFRKALQPRARSCERRCRTPRPLEYLIRGEPGLRESHPHWQGYEAGQAR